MAASSLQSATGLPATFNSIGERRVLRAEHYEDVRGVVPWVREFPRPRALVTDVQRRYCSRGYDDRCQSSLPDAAAPRVLFRDLRFVPVPF
jgi:hypothetical protein